MNSAFSFDKTRFFLTASLTASTFSKTIEQYIHKGRNRSQELQDLLLLRMSRCTSPTVCVEGAKALAIDIRAFDSIFLLSRVVEVKGGWRYRHVVNISMKPKEY